MGRAYSCDVPAINHYFVYQSLDGTQYNLIAESCPLMINTVVARRAHPTLVITFNRAVCLSDCAHVSIKAGDTPFANPVWSTSTGETANDKPANMWVCLLGDKLTDENSVKIEVKHNKHCVTLELQPGEDCIHTSLLYCYT